MKFIVFITAFSIYCCTTLAQDLQSIPPPQQTVEIKKPFPKIGLTLSGGGARGLAHIAVLRALDSAGLRADVVTGTSVGAIMGSLYSVGYTGNFIDSVAALVDWDQLMTDQVPLPDLAMQEKDMDRSPCPSINRSIMEGQGLWNTFTDLFFPVMGINDFDSLKKPFRAVAVDIANGDEVILGKGNLIEAVRASMAVPAAFSSVEIDDKLLIDGGVTRNLPVQEAIDLGAEYVIGIDLNNSNQAVVDYDDPMQVLLHIGFFQSDADFLQQKELCDYSFSFSLRNFSAADFVHAKEITEVGNASFDSLYRQFSRIKTELENKHGPQPPAKPWSNYASSYKIDSIAIRGLSASQEASVISQLTIEKGSHYTHAELKKQVQSIFSTNRYKSMHYNIIKHAEDSYAIEFVFVPKVDVDLSLGLQYNEFERINLIAQVFMHDKIFSRSKTILGAALGQNLRLRAEHFQSINKSNSLGLHPYYYLENITLQNRNKDFEVNGQYRQHYYKMGLDLLNILNNKWQLSAGWRFENLRIDPYIFTDFIVDGATKLQSVNLSYDRNTLNMRTSPTQGSSLHLSSSYVYDQNAKMNITDALGTPLNLDSLGFGTDPYIRLHFDYSHYLALHHRWTLMLNASSLNNFSFKQNLVDNYLIGGMQKTFRNQATFVGLDAADINTSSFSKVGIKVSHQVLNNAYLSLLSDFGNFGYLNSENELLEGTNFAGFAGELQYNSFIGPIHFAMTYNTYSQDIGYTLYFGVLF